MRQGSFNYGRAFFAQLRHAKTRSLILRKEAQPGYEIALKAKAMENPRRAGRLRIVPWSQLYRTRVWPELDPSRRTVTTAKPVVTSVPSSSGPVTKTSANAIPTAEAPNDKPSQNQAVNGAAK